VVNLEFKKIGVFRDQRGNFVKPFNGAFYVKESFYSKSEKNVVRGMHYSNQIKLVTVLDGVALDVVLNLETGEHEHFLLEEGNILTIPVGYAHGFQAIEPCTMLYFCSEKYDPAFDKGIRYDSFGYFWTKDAILSERDRNHPTYGEYIEGLSNRF